jgi:S-adenosylmethionine decarboxylase
MKRKRHKIFGYQLLLDLYKCKPGICDDLSACYDFLDEIVERIGMEKQAPPSIFHSDDVKYPYKAGLSGWVPLIESSVVIHTLSWKDFVSIDIYSCKYFDPKKALRYCKHIFKPKRTEQHFIERGQKYYISDSDYHTLTVKNHRTDNEKITLVEK